MFRSLPSLALALVCAGLFATWPTGPAPAQQTIYGRTTIATPERTDAGDWYGTWFYVSRTRKMALWFREVEGEPRMRLRLQDQGEDLGGFTTDWESHSDYGGRSLAGSFHVAWDRRDDDTFAGRWTWKIDSARGGYTETARFEIYRSGSGRQMVWNIEDVERLYHGKGSGPPVRANRKVWTFRKASRREARWAELPF